MEILENILSLILIIGVATVVYITNLIYVKIEAWISNLESLKRRFLEKTHQFEKDIMLLDEAVSRNSRKIDILATQISEIHTNINENIDCITREVNENNQRILVALKDALEPTKPIKPNNWDSVKEAFKGPTRDINERN